MRKFKCKKCESEEVIVALRDYISHMMHDERVPEFLLCRCKRCGYIWKEKPSDKKKEVNSEKVI